MRLQRHNRVACYVLSSLGSLFRAFWAIYQSLSSARDRRAYAMPGHLVDIGPHKMHIYCGGQGTPAVILDSGLGDTFTSWREVQPRTASFTRLCSYDRAAGCNDHTVHEGIAEWRAFPESAAQAAAAGSLGDMPLVVLSHDPDKPEPDIPTDLDKPVREASENMQQELAPLSRKGLRIIAKNSGHYIQLERPDVVVEAVGNVVAQVRQRSTTASSR